MTITSDKKSDMKSMYTMRLDTTRMLIYLLQHIGRICPGFFFCCTSFGVSSMLVDLWPALRACLPINYYSFLLSHLSLTLITACNKLIIVKFNFFRLTYLEVVIWVCGSCSSREYSPRISFHFVLSPRNA